LSVCVGAVICERFAVGASPPVGTLAVGGGGVFGGVVDVWEDVEEAVEVEEVEEALYDAGWAG
jgi:threonine dehydratase